MFAFLPKHITGYPLVPRAGVMVVAAPLVVGALGFAATGVTAGTIASTMMSSAAVANGGGVIAGSMVAALQSIGTEL